MQVGFKQFKNIRFLIYRSYFENSVFSVILNGPIKSLHTEINSKCQIDVLLQSELSNAL